MTGPGWFLMLWLCTPIGNGDFTFCFSFNQNPVGPFAEEQECLAVARTMTEEPHLQAECRFRWEVRP